MANRSTRVADANTYVPGVSQSRWVFVAVAVALTVCVLALLVGAPLFIGIQVAGPGAAWATFLAISAGALQPASGFAVFIGGAILAIGEQRSVGLMGGGNATHLGDSRR